MDTSKVATSNSSAATAKKPGKAGVVANWADERLGLGTAMKKNLRKVFPDHWSFMLGEIALWSFVILLLTGVFLTLWYHPSMAEVVHAGSYHPHREHAPVLPEEEDDSIEDLANLIGLDFFARKARAHIVWMLLGAAGRIRTPDLGLRKPPLYPTELQPPNPGDGGLYRTYRLFGARREHRIRLTA